MSFRLPVNWDYSREQPSQRLTLENLFRLDSPIYQNVDCIGTLEGFQHFLKMVYQKQTIIEQAEQILIKDNAFDSFNPSTNDLLNILSVPAEKRWALYFIVFHGPNTSGYQQFSAAIPESPYSSNNTMTFYTNHNGPYTLNSENLTSCVDRIVREFESFLPRHSSAQLLVGDWRQNFVTVFYKWLTNTRCVYDSVYDQFYNRSDIAQLISSRPNITIECKMSHSDLWALKIKQPISKQDKSPLFTVFNYSTNPLDMLKWPLTGKSEHNPLLYGVELEFTTNYNAQRLVEATDEPFFILKHDSSISGSKRLKVELVTVPMSFKAHKVQWAHWFSNLDYNEFDVTKDTTNGMHVHISRNAFSKNHLANFTFFMTRKEHTEFMIAFSERTRSSFNQYSAINSGRSDRSEVQTYRNSISQAQNVRGLVHFSSKDTVEVRLFKGIVSFADIIKNLEFVDSVYHYTQTFSMPQMTLEGYIEWLNCLPRNKYMVLRKHIRSNLNIDSFLLHGTVWKLLKGIHKDHHDTIAEKINSSDLELTNEIVTILNRRYDKRIFVFDRPSKKIVVSNSNKSKVAFLDRILEKQILKGKGLTKTSDPPPVPAETPFVESVPAPAPITPNRRRRTVAATPPPGQVEFRRQIDELALYGRTTLSVTRSENESPF